MVVAQAADHYRGAIALLQEQQGSGINTAAKRAKTEPADTTSSVLANSFIGLALSNIDRVRAITITRRLER